MSLQVWLPLNGTMENIGATNTVATNYGSTLNADGKIGSCYLFDGANDYVTLTNFSPNEWAEMSIAFWCYPTNTFDNFFLIRTSGGTHRFSIDDSNIRFRDSENSTYRTVAFASPVPVETWSHVVCIYKRGELFVYINGELNTHDTTYYTSSSTLLDNMTEISIGRYLSSSVNGYYAGKINDFRIYDHALSVAEVHELAQGLILHYKLNSGNLINKSTAIEESYVNSSGVVTSTSDWYSTDYIPVYYGRKYQTFDLAYGGSDSPCIALYGADKSFKRSISGLANTDFTIIPNEDEAYVRLSIRNKAGEFAIARFIEVEDILSDSSGYSRNGVGVGALSLTKDTPKYDAATIFSSAPYIKYTDFVYTSNIWSISCWFKKTSSVTTSFETVCGFTRGDGTDSNKKFSLYMKNNAVGFVAEGVAHSSITTIDKTKWHHVCVTSNGINHKYYLDGLLVNSYSNSSNLTDCTDFVVGGRAAAEDASSIGTPFGGSISDVRFYCTALTEDDVRKLYDVEAKIDNHNNMHGYSFDEKTSIVINNTGVIHTGNINESSFVSMLKYDPNVYIEPDGSVWAKIYRHNNPALDVFSSSDDFENSVYIDENRWFNVQVCNYIDKWELMVKGKTTSAATEWKIRWIQTTNPMSAVYADVSSSKVTKVTTDGYSSSPSSWGGLYANKGSKTYLSTNNGSSTSWWGAVGAYSAYQGGIPGWSTTTQTVTTTGYNELYVRIDNVTIEDAEITKFKKSNIIISNCFIEM